jgi:MFS family permease
MSDADPIEAPVVPDLVPRQPRRWSPGRTFDALRFPNYRLWFFGQLTSMFGTWMQTTAEGFLVFQLTHSPAYLGYVGFAAGLPSWLLMLYGGVVADRVPRRTLLVIAQSVMMIPAFTLATLTALHLVQPWHVVALAFCTGIANAFDAPARQAFVLEMVDREALTNAIALNSTMYNSASAVGPAVAGVIYALVGPAWCFFVNGVSFLAVIGALLMMKLQPMARRVRTSSGLDDLKEGLGYVFATPMVRTLIGVVMMVGLFGLGYYTLLPAWAVTILHGDATTNGLLLSARGVGAVLGALLIASLGTFKFKGKLLTIGQFVFPVFLIAFALARWVPLSLALLVGAGWGFMVTLNLSNVLLQTQAPDELRGRVMGVYAMVLFGFFTVSALLAGVGAEWLGEPAVVVLSGVALLVVAVWLYLRVPGLRMLE